MNLLLFSANQPQCIENVELVFSNFRLIFIFYWESKHSCFNKIWLAVIFKNDIKLSFLIPPLIEKLNLDLKLYFFIIPKILSLISFSYSKTSKESF